jgi:hypothetical protein
VHVPRHAIDGIRVGPIHQDSSEEGLAVQVEDVLIPPLACKMISVTTAKTLYREMWGNIKTMATF